MVKGLIGFKAFITSFGGDNPGDDPVGDLVRDLREDADLPNDFSGRKAFKEYLTDKGACAGAIKAADQLWTIFI